MSCLHFKVDRQTRICQDCGVQLAPPPRPAIDPDKLAVLQQAFPIAPPPQEIAPQPAPVVVPTVEIPEGDDIYEILLKLKGKQAPPAVVTAPEPVKIPVSGDDLAAALEASVKNATPEWIKTGEYAPDKSRPAFVPVGTPVTHHPNCTDKYPEKVEGEAPGEIVQVPLEDGTAVNQCVDCGATSAVYKADHSEREIPDEIPIPISDEPRNLTHPDEPVFDFLGGTAGTGKTYTAIQRVEQFDDAKLVATTGIAAVNLGGVTINSLLQYGDTNGLRANYETGKLGALLRRMTLSGYYRLIVDEVSMMDGHQLDILVTAIEELNVWLADNGKRLFGMTLVGDFAQLPPVNAPFVFQRPSWGRFEQHITLLTEPRRQADPDFVRALQAVRRGDRQAALSYFRPMITQGSQDKFDGSTILSTNAEVDRYNKLRMMDLTTPSDYYKADRVGEQLSEWQKNIPDNLEMKPGALVMILANKTEKDFGMVYANGDLGHYERKLNENSASVTLMRTGSSVIVQSVLKEKGVATGHTGAKLPRNEVKGSIRYMPLRVAYATTCHKSQGLSLDRVQIMFHNKFWASPGMLYVALSRARTPQGLRLVGTPEQFEARVTVNPDIRRWL